jgi:hypothetical protein
MQEVGRVLIVAQVGVGVGLVEVGVVYDTEREVANKRNGKERDESERHGPTYACKPTRH